MRIIGDVHGKIPQYLSICGENSIQLGDMGFDYSLLTDKNKFVPGNHENYDNLPPCSLGDFGVYDKFFFIRGAYSVDRDRRIIGIDWFQQEELDYFQSLDCMDLYESVKPDIVLSHDCPLSIAYNFGYYEKTKTRQLLQMCLEIHKPSLWIFGHHHRDVTFKGECEFICLNELSYIDIEV